jgi:5-methylcytosine-specific restriction endonuclease McrA
MRNHIYEPLLPGFGLTPRHTTRQYRQDEFYSFSPEYAGFLAESPRKHRLRVFKFQQQRGVCPECRKPLDARRMHLDHLRYRNEVTYESSIWDTSAIEAVHPGCHRLRTKLRRQAVRRVRVNRHWRDARVEQLSWQIPLM